MDSDKRIYNREAYKKKLKEAKEVYAERKEFVSKFKLPQVEEDISADATNEDGNAVKEPEGGIGNFSGSGELVAPAEYKEYRYTSAFGSRWGTTHWGADLAPKTPGARNCKILAAGDGVVLQARSGVSGFGCWIVIKHRDDLYTVYGHMPASSIKVKAGDKVKKGQHIAFMGKEGQSTGVHLHFEVSTNFEKRRQAGFTVDPEKYVDLRGGAFQVQVPAKRDVSPKGMTTKSFSVAAPVSETYDEQHDDSHPMHGDYTNAGAELSPEEKIIDLSYRSTYPYKGIRFKGNSIIVPSESREQFLINRVGWARTTIYRNLKPLNKKLFIHDGSYDGYEGNLYSPDAKRLFENLLLKTRKPYFEVISGFRFSNNGQLSPHEAGCAIDILVKNIDEVREIADCAWLLGVRSIGIGGDFNEKNGFIHLDIAPKGKEFQYGELPLYGGPGKWEVK